jgi:hypothetical protein
MEIMKTSGILLFSTALFCLFYLTSCSKILGIDGNGNLTTENRVVSPFTEIKSEGSFEVYISYDTVALVKVEAESNLQPYIETEVSGLALIVKNREHLHIDNNYPV